MFVFIVFLCFISSIACQQCSEGMERKQGNFWYLCRNGREVPIACVASDGSRIELGSTYRSETFVIQCSQPTPGTIQVEPVACVNQGFSVVPGAIFSNDQTFYYRCARKENMLHIELAGCVGATGELVENGGVVRRGTFVYRCVKTSTGISLEPEGCLFEGRQYNIGQDIDSQAVWYRCEAEPQRNSLGIKVKGCVYNGRKIATDQKFEEGYFMMQCRHQGNTIYPAYVSCVEKYPNGTVTEYPPGSRWLVGMVDHNRYLIECRLEGMIIKRQAIQCYYNTNEGNGYLNGGCMRRVGQQIIQCMPSTPQTPNVRIRITERPTPADEQRLSGLGLHFC